MLEKPKGENVQTKEGVIEAKSAPNSQKTSREAWTKLKAQFHSGSYKSLNELAIHYGVNPKTLRSRMVREKWNDQQRALQSKVEQVIERKLVKEVSAVDSYLASTFKRALKYERILDASMENLGSKDVNGTPLLDPDAIDSYTRSEGRIHELAKSALRLAPLCSLDVTSKGQSLGDSFASAIEKLRVSSAPKLGDDDLKRVLEAEIEE